jgi:hypothetical protein
VKILYVSAVLVVSLIAMPNPQMPEAVLRERLLAESPAATQVIMAL